MRLQKRMETRMKPEPATNRRGRASASALLENGPSYFFHPALFVCFNHSGPSFRRKDSIRVRELRYPCQQLAFTLTLERTLKRVCII